MSQSVVFRGIIAIFLTAVAACGGASDSQNVDKASVSTVNSGDSRADKDAGVVNVYSSRHYDSDRVLFDRFEAETGIKVNVIEAQGDALIERLTREGAASPADLFFTADAGMLWRAEVRGVFRKIDDPAILARVPAQYRDPENEWIGLARRARIVVYNKEQGLPPELATYEDLADPALANTICVRTSSNVYNQSLLASVIAHNGAEKAQAWANGVVANMARKPQGNDTGQIKAVAAGECRIAIVNSYYIPRITGSDDPADIEIASKIGVFFPSQETTGAHVNISGAGVTAHAPNAENAEKLLAFMLRDESQQVFAEINNEYPVVIGVAPAAPVAALGEFRADTLPASSLGENQPEAIRIFDRAGWL